MTARLRGPDPRPVHSSNFLRVDAGITICKGRKCARCPQGLAGALGRGSILYMESRRPLAESGILHSASIMAGELIDRIMIHRVIPTLPVPSLLCKGQVGAIVNRYSRRMPDCQHGISCHRQCEFYLLSRATR